MAIPTNRMSYVDCYDIYEKAKDDPSGIRIPFNDRASANHYRMRMHNARAVDRKENMKLHKPGDPLYGQSIYDVLVLTLKQSEEDGTWFIYIEPKNKHIAVDEIESLSELESEELPDGQTLS